MKQDIQKYLNSYQSKRLCYVNSIRNGLIFYYTWVKKKKRIFSGLIVPGNDEERELDILTDTEFDLMIFNANNKRDKLLFTIMRYTGIRKGGARTLKVSYINKPK